MKYTKKPNDTRYRLVNLRCWNRSVPLKEFPAGNEIQDNSLYEVLEVEHLDGSREIISDGECQENAFCTVKCGEIEVVFSGTRVIREMRPCVGHLFAVYKNRRGIRYHFPCTESVSGSGDNQSLIYKALIGTTIQESDVQIICDEYFASAFKLEQG